MTYFLNGTRGFNSPTIIPPQPGIVPTTTAPRPTPTQLISAGLVLGLLGITILLTEPDKEELTSRK